MFNTRTQPNHTTSNSNSNGSVPHGSRFNNWVYDDDVENTNEQIDIPSQSFFTNAFSDLPPIPSPIQPPVFSQKLSSVTSSQTQPPVFSPKQPPLFSQKLSSVTSSQTQPPVFSPKQPPVTSSPIATPLFSQKLSSVTSSQTQPPVFSPKQPPVTSSPIATPLFSPKQPPVTSSPIATPLLSTPSWSFPKNTSPLSQSTPTPTQPPVFSPKQPPVFSQKLSSVTSSPIATPLLSTPSWSFSKNTSPLSQSTPTPTPTPTPKMYTVNRNPLYNRRQYRGTLETTTTAHPKLITIEYITISDVFVYVTLGMTICDTYLEELTEIITNEITNYTTIKIDETTFNGKTYKLEIPVFSFEQYGVIAKYCLEWALCNPEKLGHM
jgi:hypothetical protein